MSNFGGIEKDAEQFGEKELDQKFGQGGTSEAQASDGPQELGNDILLKSGRFGPYVERGEKRASIPKDIAVEDVTSDLAERLLAPGAGCSQLVLPVAQRES